jgi:hypothetical protein
VGAGFCRFTSICGSHRCLNELIHWDLGDSGRSLTGVDIKVEVEVWLLQQIDGRDGARIVVPLHVQ